MYEILDRGVRLAFIDEMPANLQPREPGAPHTRLRLDTRGQLDLSAIMGYSLGARIAAFLAKAHGHRLRRMILGGLGDHLVIRAGLPLSIAAAMEAPSVDSLAGPTDRSSAASRSDQKRL